MNYPIDHNVSDQELIALLRTGDEKALEKIFNHTHAGLLHFAMQFVKDRLAAEDYVAGSYIKIWAKRKDFSNLGSIKSFLYTAVKNACLNHIKQSNRHSVCHKEILYLSDKSSDFLNDYAIKTELLQKLWEDVEQLPAVRKKIFKMYFAEGLSSFEIAESLQISVDTVRVQKARALHALRALIKR
ncbi:MAG TPA: sigma-70 family RNA polymerase sigma factor [Chitinophagaceae bacterium]